MNSDPDFDNRVLIWGEDGRFASDVLSKAGLSFKACDRAEELETEMRAGLGVALLAEEALTPNLLRELVSVLQGQPPWSDVPLIVFAQNDDSIEIILKVLGALGNVTVLERPVRITTLLSAVRSGLRGRRRQYQLRDLLGRLEDADRRKDDFLAMLGHELRNPLAAIQNALTLLTHEEAPDSRTERQHGVIDRQLRHLTRMVDDLLDVSRITQGKVVLQCQLVDLRKIVEGAMQTLASGETLQQHFVSVTTSSAIIPVHGDAVRLEQIVWNLLSNAVKYTPHGGHIWIDLSIQDGDAMLSVRDDGIGIPTVMLPRVFEPFIQLEHSLDRAQGGIGLGLPLVRNLVLLHGGSIRAASGGKGRGTEFLVRFPLAPPATIAPTPSFLDELEDAPAPAEVENADARSLRILVVDDNDDGRETMHELLSVLGHDVELAGDGFSGIEKALLCHPELALIDIGLPGCDGYEVARRIRGQLSDGSPWLVAMSGYGQPDDRRRALDAGFDRHLVKPVSFEALTSLLREIENGADHGPVASPAAG
jgi:signal transduction histidine kinase/ActR/RegA family two-component response regulator